MIRSFLISFRLKNTYRVNSIIYSVKQLPLIRRILPDRLYESRGLKIFGNIISALYELGTFFVGKLVYIYLMMFMLGNLYETDPANTFLHLFVFLTLTGGLLNTFMFNPTRDKYYAMFLMNMDAKKYTISNYYYNLLKTFIGFLPSTILFSMFYGIPWWIGVILAAFVTMLKVVVSSIWLWRYEKTGEAINENLPPRIVWIGTGLFMAAAYGLPVLGVVLNEMVFLILAAIVILLGIPGLFRIRRFDQYRSVYKQILTQNTLVMAQKETQVAMVKDNITKQIDVDESISSNKEGYEFFHDLFVKRHRKILTKAVKKQTAVLSGLFVAAIIALQFNPEVKAEVNSLLMSYLPLFILILYAINRGTAYTQAMFMNCDHSMLTYRFFRTPKVILGLFRERLKTIILINLMPAMVIAIGLPVLLLITGGTDNVLNYAALFFSIIAISVFFSVHYLVLYYLLQPYNVSTEMKSSTYSVIQTITYLLCFAVYRATVPTLVFGAGTVLFSVLYSFASLYLVYRYAPKTFKLRT